MVWKPSLYDIHWLAERVHLLTEGGILIYPNARLMYRISHKRKTLSLLNPQILSEDETSKEMHERTKQILLFMDYKMHSNRGGG